MGSSVEDVRLTLISGWPKTAVGEARMMSHLEEKVTEIGEGVRRTIQVADEARTHIMASSQPPPSCINVEGIVSAPSKLTPSLNERRLTAYPLTAATIGLRNLVTSVQWARKSFLYTSANSLLTISLMSAPAAKALSLPVSTTAPTLSSLLASLRAALSSVKRGELRAVGVVVYCG